MKTPAENAAERVAELHRAIATWTIQLRNTQSPRYKKQLAARIRQAQQEILSLE